MNANPVEVRRFRKIEDGNELTCDIERFEDGSVGVFGEAIDTWMFEFTEDAMKRALGKVEEAGYVPIESSADESRQAS